MVERVERTGEGAMREVGGAVVVSFYPLTHNVLHVFRMVLMWALDDSAISALV